MSPKGRKPSEGRSRRAGGGGPDQTEGAPEVEVAEAAHEVEVAEAGPEVAEDVAVLRARAGEYLELAQRVQADFENYKKRMLREQTHAVERAGERVVRELLPVVDDLDRTIGAAESEEVAVRAEHLTDAVRLLRDKLLAVLSKEGVESIDPAGEPFDPNFHEAVMQVPRPDLDEQTVTDVYQKGYLLKGRLLRPARVAVSSRPEDGGKA